MSQLLLEGPAIEPVSIAEAREWLRIEHQNDDDLIGAIIVSARLLIEQTIRQFLIFQKWRILPDATTWRDGIVLPLRPLQTIDAVRLRPRSGAAIVLDPADYDFLAHDDSAQLSMTAWPDSASADARLEVDVTVGYGASVSSTPAPLRQAMRLLIARWYEQRGDALTPQAVSGLPTEVLTLLAPYRRLRLA